MSLLYLNFVLKSLLNENVLLALIIICTSSFFSKPFCLERYPFIYLNSFRDNINVYGTHLNKLRHVLQQISFTWLDEPMLKTLTERN